MCKSWLLVTKLGPCVALGHHLHHEQQIRVNNNTYSSGTSERSTKNEFENQQFVIFDPWKVFWNYIDYYVRWIFKRKFLQRPCKIQLPRENLGEQKILEKALFRLSKSLKSNILTSMVPSLGYTGFFTIVPFWATWRLDRMVERFVVISIQLINRCLWKGNSFFREDLLKARFRWNLKEGLNVLFNRYKGTIFRLWKQS